MILRGKENDEDIPNNRKSKNEKTQIAVFFSIETPYHSNKKSAVTVSENTGEIYHFWNAIYIQLKTWIPAQVMDKGKSLTHTKKVRGKPIGYDTKPISSAKNIQT